MAYFRYFSSFSFSYSYPRLFLPVARGGAKGEEERMRTSSSSLCHSELRAFVISVSLFSLFLTSTQTFNGKKHANNCCVSSCCFAM